MKSLFLQPLHFKIHVIFIQIFKSGSTTLQTPLLFFLVSLQSAPVCIILSILPSWFQPPCSQVLLLCGQQQPSLLPSVSGSGRCVILLKLRPVPTGIKQRFSTQCEQVRQSLRKQGALIPVTSSCHYYSSSPASVRLEPASWDLTLCLHSLSKSQVVLSPSCICSSLCLRKVMETMGIQASASWTNILAVSMEKWLRSSAFPPWGTQHCPWWSVACCPSAGQGWCKTSCNLGGFLLLLDDTGAALGRVTAAGFCACSPLPLNLSFLCIQ